MSLVEELRVPLTQHKQNPSSKISEEDGDDEEDILDDEKPERLWFTEFEED